MCYVSKCYKNWVVRENLEGTQADNSRDEEVEKLLLIVDVGGPMLGSCNQAVQTFVMPSAEDYE